MLRIILLAFGAAVFPALLACVAILISRPEPRRLIFAFYLGGLLVSVASGVVVVMIFQEGGEIAGSSSEGPHGTVSIAVGVVGLFFCWLLSSHRGRALIDAWRDRHTKKMAPKANAGPSWMERRLGGASVGIAFLVGGAINLPGPFYLLALGDIATGNGAAEQLAMILLFNAIMFLLLEIPLIGYLFDPDWTARAVAVSGVWLNAHGLRILGVLIGVFSISLMIQGIGTAA